MREDQEFTFGKQWSKDSKDRRYVANLTLRLVAQKTAFLYAKNPKAVAKKRAPQHHLVGRNTDDADALMQSGAMMMQQAGAMGGMGGMAPGMPPEMASGMMNAAQGAIGGMMPMATGQPPDIDMMMSRRAAATAVDGMRPQPQRDFWRVRRAARRHADARHGRRANSRQHG